MQALCNPTYLQNNPVKDCINKTVIELWGALARSIFDLQNLNYFAVRKTRLLAFEHRYFHKI